MPSFELDLFTWFNGFPAWVARATWPVMQVGSLAGPTAVAAFVLVWTRSGRLAAAMDLSQEDPRTAARYDLNLAARDLGTSDGPGAVRKLLLARRLIEAGVRCVSLSLSDYDTHGANFSRLRLLLPTLDHALHAFTTDLAERGMLDQVTIVVWGEFGRTPRVNKSAGRDHWPRLAGALVAGGGMRTGQAVGSSTRYAEAAKDRPVDYQEVHATLYHNLGIDPRTTTIVDPNGRPQYLLDYRDPIAELV